MSIALASYQSFDYTRRVVDSGKKTWNTLTSGALELVKKVTRIALAILALPFVFLFDLVLTPVAALYQRCSAKPASIPSPPFKPAASEPTAFPPQLDPAQVICSNPYPAGFPDQPYQFLEGAIRMGLGINGGKISQLTNIIREGNKDMAAIWLVAHCLIARSHSAVQLPNSLYFLNKQIEPLYSEFSKLSPADRSATFLAVVRDIDSNPDINTPIGRCIIHIAELAEGIVDNLMFRALFARARPQIQALADGVAKELGKHKEKVSGNHSV